MQKCKKSPHINHLNTMNEILLINQKSNERKNSTKNNLIGFEDNDSRDKQGSKQNESSPNYKNRFNQDNNEDDKKNASDISKKKMPRAGEQNASGSVKNDHNQEYENQYNYEINNSESIEVRGDRCKFCNKVYGQPRVNENCFKKGCKVCLYHEDCLAKDVKEKVSTGKKLSDVMCKYCGETFDYSQIYKLDKKSADILRDRQYNTSSDPSSNNRNEFQEDNDNSVKIGTCDMKHEHANEDRIVLNGVLCTHGYFKGCLRNYLNQNIASFKSIDEVKCPISGCPSLILSEAIRRNFPDIAMRIKK